MPRKRGTAIADLDMRHAADDSGIGTQPAAIVERSRPRLRLILWKSRREVRNLFAISLFTFFFISTSFAIPVPLQTSQAVATVEGVVTSATNGRMLPHARIFLRSSLAKDNFVTWADSDDEGHFLFKALEEGTYE